MHLIAIIVPGTLFAFFVAGDWVIDQRDLLDGHRRRSGSGKGGEWRRRGLALLAVGGHHNGGGARHSRGVSHLSLGTAARGVGIAEIPPD